MNASPAPDRKIGIANASSAHLSAPSSLSDAGFTLIELLIASVISGVILILVGIGLINVLRANQSNEVETRQRVQLSRALDFMSDEIRESREVSLTLPVGWSMPGCEALFFVQKPMSGVADPQVGYYSCPPSVGDLWKGPRVLYRAVTPLPTGNEKHPLVDALSDEPLTNCKSGPSASDLGVKAVITDSKKIELCIKGDQKSSASPTIELKVLTFARGS
jgi:prepilin-type N-terminal cleavage/methylation domain-containing protein